MKTPYVRRNRRMREVHLHRLILGALMSSNVATEIYHRIKAANYSFDFRLGARIAGGKNENDYIADKCFQMAREYPMTHGPSVCRPVTRDSAYFADGRASNV